MRADLHLHTTASDGMFPSGAIVASAVETKLDCIAITDHDALGGIEAARDTAKEAGIAFIPGVEISAGGDEEIHILGYGISDRDEKLLQLFADMQNERILRAHKICDRLISMGMPVDKDKIFASAGDSVGRPHIARDMVEKGYVPDIAQAFSRFLGKGKPAFVSREKRPADQTIRLLRECGAVPVLAHPILLNKPREQLLPLIAHWKDAGLMGLEVYHPTQQADFSAWRRIAQDFDLIITGGSDFHAPNRPNGPIGSTADAWLSAKEDIARLMSAISAQSQL